MRKQNKKNKATRVGKFQLPFSFCLVIRNKEKGRREGKKEEKRMPSAGGHARDQKAWERSSVGTKKSVELVSRHPPLAPPPSPPPPPPPPAFHFYACPLSKRSPATRRPAPSGGGMEAEEQWHLVASMAARGRL